jgi:uncharacterized protein YndB with AHSA1/START domain
MNALESTRTQSDREIVVARVFDAPPELVFKAFTDPEHVAQWWGPKGFTTTIRQMDVRPGGIWRLVMHGPNGRDYHNRIVYLEIDRPKRLVFKHEPDAECEPVGHQTTVTFDKQGDQTKVTMRMRFADAAERNHVVEKYGAIEGGNQTLQRLAEHLPKMAETEHFSSEKRPERVVTITRTLDAPRELVFQAWIDPAHVAQWWGPGGFTNPVCELDARQGGKIWIVMRGPNGVDYPMSGTFREIIPPHRLVFTAVAEDADGQPILESLTTVSFVKKDGKTELTMHAHAIGFVADAASKLAGMQQGWSQSLDRFEQHMKAAAR